MSDVKDKSADIGEDPEEGFLSRWSRRKLESEDADAGDATEARSIEAQDEDRGGAEPTPVLTDEDMPPLEELGEQSDYSGFFSAGVSETLRKAALHRLFRSPKFNVCDGLDDYAGDYTKFTPLGDVVTADMRHHMERALKKLANIEETVEGEAAPALAQEASTSSDGDEAHPEPSESVEVAENAEKEDGTDRV
jgi:hypothetical protein